MKTTELLLLAGAAFATWYLFKGNNSSSNTVNNLGKAVNGISEIFTGATKGQPGGGWRYFTDGTSIGPDGKYYSNGVLVWSPI